MSNHKLPYNFRQVEDSIKDYAAKHPAPNESDIKARLQRAQSFSHAKPSDECAYTIKNVVKQDNNDRVGMEKDFIKHCEKTYRAKFGRLPT